MGAPESASDPFHCVIIGRHDKDNQMILKAVSALKLSFTAVYISIPPETEEDNLRLFSGVVSCFNSRIDSLDFVQRNESNTSGIAQPKKMEDRLQVPSAQCHVQCLIFVNTIPTSFFVNLWQKRANTEMQRTAHPLFLFLGKQFTMSRYYEVVCRNVDNLMGGDRNRNNHRDITNLLYCTGIVIHRSGNSLADALRTYQRKEKIGTTEITVMNSSSTLGRDVFEWILEVVEHLLPTWFEEKSNDVAILSPIEPQVGGNTLAAAHAIKSQDDIIEIANTNSTKVDSVQTATEIVQKAHEIPTTTDGIENDTLIQLPESFYQARQLAFLQRAATDTRAHLRTDPRKLYEYTRLVQQLLESIPAKDRNGLTSEVFATL